MLSVVDLNLEMVKFFFDATFVDVKPRPKDRNMHAQHIATLLGKTCCVRLATVLRYVATCWVLLDQV